MKKLFALFILLSLCATDVLAQGTTPNPNRVGGSVNGGGGGGSGSVTVVGSGNLTSTDIVTGGGSQTIQTPSANAKIDSSGNISALSFISGGATPANSGVLILNGLTSGSVALSAADIAGTAITYVLPSTNGSAGQFLKDNGVTTCPTLASGAPTTCHLLAWATVSGSGTVTSVTFTGDGTVLSSTPSSAVTAAGTLTATLATQTANTVLGALTATTPSGLALPSCSTASSALKYTTGTGFGCNSAITASAVAVGGITGLGTGVGTALAINIGSAGAPVLFNGAGGTPSSLVCTNCSGTAASLTAGNASVAPAGTLTGTTLNSTVVTSSLTSVGTITTGTWQGTAVDTTRGGLGANNSSATGIPILSGGTSTVTTICSVLSSDFVMTSTTTLANVGMSLPFTANRQYVVIGTFLFTAGGAGGYKISFNGGGASENYDMAVWNAYNSGSFVFSESGLFNPVNDTTSDSLTLQGAWSPSTSSTMNIQAAQNSSNATALHLSKGSSICIIPVN